MDGGDALEGDALAFDVDSESELEDWIDTLGVLSLMSSVNDLSFLFLALFGPTRALEKCGAKSVQSRRKVSHCCKKLLHEHGHSHESSHYCKLHYADGFALAGAKMRSHDVQGRMAIECLGACSSNVVLV